MKYADKFPNMGYIFEEQGSIIRGRSASKCCICGFLTEYREINYEAPFCSEECVAEMDRRANDAFKHYIENEDPWENI